MRFDYKISALEEREDLDSISMDKLHGGEFTSNEFMDYYIRHGIKLQFSISRTPQ
jgi:hypothetical protein